MWQWRKLIIRANISIVTVQRVRISILYLKKYLKTKMFTLKHPLHLIPIIKEMLKLKKIQKDAFIICNGFKRQTYLQYVCELQ